MQTSNIQATGTTDLFHKYLNKKFLENLEPNLVFWKFGKWPVNQKGFSSVQWARMTKSTVSASNATITEWTTPSFTDLKIGTISVSCEQYGQVAQITDILEDTTLLNVVGQAMIELAHNASRIMDEVVQSALLTNGTNVIYAGSATSRATLAATDTMTTTCINKARAFLSTKGAKPFAGGYIWIAHPNVTYDMREQVGWNAWVEVKKYTDLVKDIVAWEIWTLMWVRIVESSFVQTVSSTVTVYPTYVFGEGAYGTSQLQAYETTFISRNNKDSYNPLGLFSIVGWKMAIASIILQQDALVRIETASTLSYAW